MPRVSIFNVCTHYETDANRNEGGESARPLPAVVEFHPSVAEKFATAGAGGKVKMWELNAQCVSGVHHLATLAMHNSAVNAIAWNAHSGELASVCDEGYAIVWKQQCDARGVTYLNNECLETAECWKSAARCKVDDELQCVDWLSKDVALVASLRGKLTVVDLRKQTPIQRIAVSSCLIQGLTLDPFGHFLAFQTPNCCRIYKRDIKKKTIKFTHFKSLRNLHKEGKSSKLFTTSATEVTRKPCFSPDGLFLCAVSGQVSVAEHKRGAIHLFHRSDFSKKVSSFTFSDERNACMAAFNPKLFAAKATEMEDGSLSKVFGLTYRMFLATITGSSVYIFDSTRLKPVFHWNDTDTMDFIHLSWNSAGNQLLASDKEGFLLSVALEIGR